MTDTPKRTIIKTLSWRVMATIATFLVSYVISSDISIASGIAGTQIFIHTFLYYIHERAWIKVEWGKK